MLQIFRHSCFFVATVKLLQSLRSFEIVLLYYCSAGVTDLYPISTPCVTEPNLNTLPNRTLSHYINERFLIFMPYGTMPYLITLRNYNLSYYITELYAILILHQTITSPNSLPNYTVS